VKDIKRNTNKLNHFKSHVFGSQTFIFNNSSSAI